MEDDLNFMTSMGVIHREVRWRPSWNQMQAPEWAITNLESYDQIVGYLEELFDELKEL